MEQLLTEECCELTSIACMSGGEQEGETLLEICTGPGEEHLLWTERNALKVFK